MRRSALSRAIRDMLLVALLCLTASAIVHADEQLQDWIPQVLEMPEDVEVLADRAIGSTVRLFSIATATDVDALLSEWQESLTNGGYPVTRGSDDLMQRSIEFSGPGIANAKIIVAPSAADGRSVIDFDATLN